MPSLLLFSTVWGHALGLFLALTKCSIVDVAWQAFPFLVNPALQDAQIAPLWEVQAAPVAATPFEQVQLLASRCPAH